MKKIPTLFVRKFENHKVVEITDEVTPGLDWVLKGEGIATIKWDGACCMVNDHELYKRYDAKRGKPIPDGAIPCQEKADTITGHFPCWVKCKRENPSDKWFFVALDNSEANIQIEDATYEAIGPHFQGNPYDLAEDRLIQHGIDEIYVERSFEGIKNYLEEHEIEGIVFWKDGEPRCKIKRRDFGFRWNVR